MLFTAGLICVISISLPIHMLILKLYSFHRRCQRSSSQARWYPPTCLFLTEPALIERIVLVILIRAKASRCQSRSRISIHRIVRFIVWPFATEDVSAIGALFTLNSGVRNGLATVRTFAARVAFLHDVEELAAIRTVRRTLNRGILELVSTEDAFHIHETTIPISLQMSTGFVYFFAYCLARFLLAEDRKLVLSSIFFRHLRVIRPVERIIMCSTPEEPDRSEVVGCGRCRYRKNPR